MRLSGLALPMGTNVWPRRSRGTVCLRQVEVGSHRQSVFRPIFWKGIRMNTLISALVTFVVVILVLYLVNMLPIDGRAKQIVDVIVIIIGIISLLKNLTVF
jgi:hypothetical protein